MAYPSRKRDDIMASNKTTKTQEYAVLWLNSQQHNYTEIAKELKISVENIEKILKDTKTATINESAQKSMITHTSGKQINSVAIMTKAASEIVDNNRIKHSDSSRPSEKNIFRPKS